MSAMRPARLPPSASNTPRPTASALRNPRAAVRGGAGAAGDDRRNSMMPLPPSGRRSTLMTNGRLSHSVNRNSATSRLTSVGGGGGASASRVKDPRPLNDRGYLQGVARDLVAFIVERGYDGAQMTARTLASASSKEFIAIFTFLLQRLDSTFEFASAGGGGTGGERGGERGGGGGGGGGVGAGGGGARRFEDELPLLLKMLGYPYTMSRSALSAMGSPHTWPALVGVLHWLMNMVRLKEVYTVDELSQRENDVISRRDAFFLDNTVKAYDAWLSGAEEFEEVDAERNAFFSADSAARAESIEQLTRENTALTERLQLLRGGGADGGGGNGAPAQSPLDIARQRLATLNDNIGRLDQLLPKLDDHLASVNAHMAGRQQRIAELKSSIANLRHKRMVHLEPVLAKQESQAIDADRIVSQREKLRTALQECAAETQRVENEQKAVERRLALKMQQLQTALRKYHEDVEVYDNFQSCLKFDLDDDGEGDNDDADADDGIDDNDHDSGAEHAANSDNGGFGRNDANNGSHSESSMSASSSSTAASLLSSTRDQQQQQQQRRRRHRKQRGHTGYHDTVLDYPDWKARLTVALNPDISIIDARQLLLPTGRDIERDIMPHLQVLRSAITRLSPLADAAAIRLDEQLDVASERGMMLQHDVAVLRGTKEQKEAQYSEEREAFQKCLAVRSQDILKEDENLKMQQVEAEQRVRDEDERIVQLEMTKKEVEGQLREIRNRAGKMFERECLFTKQHVANVNQIKEDFVKVTAQRRKKQDSLVESLVCRQPAEGQQQQQGEGSSRQG